MTRLLAALAVPALLLAWPAPAHADPLVCIDPGPTHVGPYVIDIPEVCLL